MLGRGKHPTRFKTLPIRSSASPTVQVKLAMAAGLLDDEAHVGEDDRDEELDAYQSFISFGGKPLCKSRRGRVIVNPKRFGFVLQTARRSSKRQRHEFTRVISKAASLGLDEPEQTAYETCRLQRQQSVCLSFGLLKLMGTDLQV